MANVTPYEQYFIELVNRDRADPAAAAARQGYDLNQGIYLDRISEARKQPLALVNELLNAADLHSRDQVVNSYFSHTGLNGSDPQDRILAAQYVVSPSATYSAFGENIVGFSGTSQIPINKKIIDAAHAGLWRSSSHRKNFFLDEYNEIGVGSYTGPGDISGEGLPYSVVATQNFAYGGRLYITGVVIDDKDRDRFYDIGEGLGDVDIEVRGPQFVKTETTYTSGGYAVAVPTGGTYTITFSGDDLAAPITKTVVVRGQNVKVDAIVPNSYGASSSYNVINGTSDGERLTGLLVADIITGLGGDDTIFGKGGNDRLRGGSGDDQLSGGLGNDRMYGARGDDLLQGGPGDDRLVGDHGRDTLLGGGGRDALKGDQDADVLIGGDRKDTLNGGTNDDDLRGGNGADKLIGGDGDDTLRGEDGNDRVFAGAGDDRITGGRGNDQIKGGDDRDTVKGGPGDDVISGGTRGDQLDGGSGNDSLEGGQGSDTLKAGRGNDTIHGNEASDDINGGDGRDQIFGEQANDELNGGTGRDLIFGGDGDDTLNGGAGKDTLDGGAGEDRYVIEPGTDVDFIAFEQGDDIDVTAYDFTRGELRAIFNASTGGNGDTIVMALGGGDMLRIDVASGFADPTLDDFLF